jgi:hypothetical protein
MIDVIYDLETYPNCFTLSAELTDLPLHWQFEVSDFKDEREQIIEWCKYLISIDARMVGFNNVSFDYPVLHLLLRNPKATARQLYDKAQSLIFSENKFEGMVFPSDRLIPQLDLYKIHHFDNKARTTSLKALEYQMQMDNISDLPFPVGSTLNQDQIKVLLDYNLHDVRATKLFYHESLKQIGFREELTAKHGRDFLNHNDTKIGAEIFQMELEKSGVQCYSYGKGGRVPRQTQRESINLHECIPQWIQFTHLEFQRIKTWFNSQVISGTKGVFSDIIAKVGNLDFVYGTGGLHASVTNEFFTADDEWMIYDMDVTSLYPSIAIEHGHYPEHLGPKFVDVYRDLRTQRVGYKKGSAENAMLKLALNGVYGKSNDKFSIFYDPLFTMKITIGGQMMLSLLAERLYYQGLQIIQVNTDGITIRMLRSDAKKLEEICTTWQQKTKLTLEYAEYSKMVIRDVNNYIAVKTNGEVKRKGAYEYDKEWHQDSSASVVAKVAEQVLIHGKPLEQTVLEWPDKMDFMIRAKVPRTSKLIYVDENGEQSDVGNIQRYYISPEGGTLLKVMPPMKGKTENRWFDVQKNQKVCLCNKITEATLPIGYEWYINEVRKLCLKSK